ncbi:pyrroloquinoline quinone biosynthesis protein PqqF [Erwinia sp. MMLR14_017]|uniref:pyrroloquinoline quinone biosynthesis protein PqqF n=1 Tax=Erwinia sp. MMLR14_017 TaxID=3093842 RepID=UPI00298FB6E7|nr:pyrroloquinoline quinone biosynthesis protein PqqF [Erwinia sp. MMLR14_017]MDW8845496.1 pyrroloquinoline quinone biosynthesis protein PqqF [Erwinia sp. MMLR14_017]
MQAVRRITLANGLRVNLIHDPDASRAAALIQLAAGSHGGPREWPGLAHLLEHVLFAGSEGYQDQQRLMAWGPANGARLNATTQAHYTAWFFDIAPEKFRPGLRRLTDMLASPLLTQESVRQEVAIIDAEFQLLSRHTGTLCEAALSQAFATPQRLYAFHVGNRAAFGEDDAALQQALQAYHQRFFRAEKLELWLQGPQSVAALAELAEEMGAIFSSFPALSEPEIQPLTLNSPRHYGLHLASAERLQLSAAVSGTPEMLAVLRELLTDSAERSLLATLRELGLADDVTLLEPYRAPHQSLISVQFELCDAVDPAIGEALLSLSALKPASGKGGISISEAVFTPSVVEALFSRWVQQLTMLNEDLLSHYAALARRRFTQLSALDQLRARAFGFVPPTADVPLTERWQALLSELEPEKLTALWTSSRVDASPVQLQGFTLHSGAVDWQSSPLGNGPEMTFYAAGETDTLPSLPDEQAPLRHFPAFCQPVLLLNPAADSLSRQAAALVEAALQPVIGHSLHQGGELSFAQQQGIWLLQLSATPDLLLTMLAAAIDALATLSPATISQGKRRYHQAMQSQSADIAIRAMLARLPELISSPAKAMPRTRAKGTVGDPQPVAASQAEISPLACYGASSLSAVPWQATLYGGDAALQTAISRLLSRWPVGPLPGASYSSPQQTRPASVKREGEGAALLANISPPAATTGDEAALLLFCPLIDHTAECLAAWQLLAALYEPEFFQRLRVELNIGYVVSCRYHHSAGEAGLLFALQSPTLTSRELKEHIVNFIRAMPDVIADVTEEELQKKSAILIAALPGQAIKTPAQCLAHWQQQQLNLPGLSPSLLASFSREKLHSYSRRLATENSGWIWAD